MSKPIPRKIPTVRATRTFAKQFSKEDWERMCKVPAFVEAVDTNLTRAQHIGIQILRGEYLEPDDTFEIL